MLSLYNITIFIYRQLIGLASIFNPKARKWIRGRKNWPKKLEAFRNDIPQDQPVVWVHCASLGEFEQGRPIIEDLKNRHPAVKVLLTFFSPSGFEVRKNYEHADLIMYLPVDTRANARRFMKIARPTITIFVKYEFWHYFISQAREISTLTLLVSATFRPQQLFFKWYGGFFREILAKFDNIFVQEQQSADLLSSIGYRKAVVAGDNRVDRVGRLALAAPPIPEAHGFQKGSPIFIAGSTWPADEKVLLPFLHQSLPANWKIILAPHQIDREHILQLKHSLPGPCILFSELKTTGPGSARSLIIDNIGILSSLYQYGRVAYIGGGFGVAIHNLLEPMTFGLPLIFGPNHRKFREATEIKRTKGGFAIEDTSELTSAFNTLLSEESYRGASEACKSYIQDNMGATDLVLDFINRKNILF